MQYEDAECLRLVQNRIQRLLADTELKFLGPQKARNLLTSRMPISFSRISFHLVVFALYFRITINNFRKDDKMFLEYLYNSSRLKSYYRKKGHTDSTTNLTG
jgi:hypothetical protein